MAEWVKKVRATTTLLRRDRKKNKKYQFHNFLLWFRKIDIFIIKMTYIVSFYPYPFSSYRQILDIDNKST